MFSMLGLRNRTGLKSKILKFSRNFCPVTSSFTCFLCMNVRSMSLAIGYIFIFIRKKDTKVCEISLSLSLSIHIYIYVYMFKIYIYIFYTYFIILTLWLKPRWHNLQIKDITKLVKNSIKKKWLKTLILLENNQPIQQRVVNPTT